MIRLWRDHCVGMDCSDRAKAQIARRRERAERTRLVTRLTCEIDAVLEADLKNGWTTVLVCVDSRVPVETLFDHDPGDIFVVRLAGNFMSDAALASIEYAVEILKSPLVMVLGHTSCGGVTAAVEYVRSGTTLPGHMQVLADTIAPAARATQHQNGDWIGLAVIENVRQNVAALRASTPIMTEALRRGVVEIVGGVYDLATGIVTLV